MEVKRGFQLVHSLEKYAFVEENVWKYVEGDKEKPNIGLLQISPTGIGSEHGTLNLNVQSLFNICGLIQPQCFYGPVNLEYLSKSKPNKPRSGDFGTSIAYMETLRQTKDDIKAGRSKFRLGLMTLLVDNLSPVSKQILPSDSLAANNQRMSIIQHPELISGLFSNLFNGELPECGVYRPGEDLPWRNLEIRNLLLDAVTKYLPSSAPDSPDFRGVYAAGFTLVDMTDSTRGHAKGTTNIRTFYVRSAADTVLGDIPLFLQQDDNWQLDWLESRLKLEGGTIYPIKIKERVYDTVSRDFDSRIGGLQFGILKTENSPLSIDDNEISTRIVNSLKSDGAFKPQGEDDHTEVFADLDLVINN